MTVIQARNYDYFLYINLVFFVIPKISYTVSLRGETSANERQRERESLNRRVHTAALHIKQNTLSFLEGVEKRGNVFNFPRVYYPTARRFPRDFTGDGA